MTNETVLKLLSSLNVAKATGSDNLPARFLKDAASEIVLPLSHLINLSITTKTVPIDFNTARVVPLFKKGDRNFEGNYRPVSILPVVSKILERIVYNQVNEYLNRHSIIFKLQSGFRSQFST